MSSDAGRTKRISHKKKERLISGAYVVIPPPPTLGGEECDYWAKLIQARPSFDWLPPDLLRLERICMMMSLSDRYFLEISRGREDEAETLQMYLAVERAILAQSKALHLHLQPFRDHDIVSDVANLRDDPDDKKGEDSNASDMLG